MNRNHTAADINAADDEQSSDFLAQAADSVSATIVHRVNRFSGAAVSRPLLTSLYERGKQSGHDTKKIALVRCSPLDICSLDYAFVQVIPGARPMFNFAGNCGHSLLCAAAVARSLFGKKAAQPIAVRVMNTDEIVIAEATGARSVKNEVIYTARFLQIPRLSLEACLVNSTNNGQPTFNLKTREFPCIRTSLVSFRKSNPYVWVNAHDLGLSSAEKLFACEQHWLDTLDSVRRFAAKHASIQPDEVFPKVCAVGAADGHLFCRAITVGETSSGKFAPVWHRTLALTGLACLAASANIPGNVVANLVNESGQTPSELMIRTKEKKSQRVTSLTDYWHGDLYLERIDVPDKTVRVLGPLPPLNVSSQTYN